MSDLDDLFTITCGKCKGIAPVARWCELRGAAIKDDAFVCPYCFYTFRRVRKKDRKPWEPFVELVEVGK